MSRDRWGKADASSGHRGGGWTSFRRALGDADNPMSWGFPLYTLAGIRVRVHLFFVVYVVIEMLRAAAQGPALAWMTGSTLGTLFLIVLLHEYGHCIACRWVGGEADHILLWPLGGLASCRPPHDWNSDFITTAGGPLVNLVLVPILGGLVYLLVGNWHAVVFDPFHPFASGGQWVLGAGAPVRILWTAHYTNLVLLGFNVLVPMLPMDGGRLVQALLWRRLGYHRASAITAGIGLVAAACLGILGMVMNEALLLGIAIFGGFTCYALRQRLRIEGPYAWMDQDFAEPVHRGPTKAELKRRRREEEHFRRVEQILEKISREGMGSLTRAEKRTLQRETERKRSG